MAVISVGLLIFNQRDAVRNIKANQELDKTVVSIANDKVEDRNEGLLSASEVVAAEEQKAKFLRWALRPLGFILMSMGFVLVLKPLSVLADVIPFLGNLVGAATGLIATLLAGGISLVIIALAWVTFRPFIPILLIAGAALFFGIKKLMSKPAQPPQTA